MSIIEVIGGVKRTYKYDVVDCTTPECPPDKVSRQASPVLSKLDFLEQFSEPALMAQWMLLWCSI